MLESRSSSAVDRVFEGLQETRQSTSRTQLRPGERVEVLDMCGRPTGILCKVQSAEVHTVGVLWGGETITVGRSWLRRVS